VSAASSNGSRALSGGVIAVPVDRDGIGGSVAGAVAACLHRCRRGLPQPDRHRYRRHLCRYRGHLRRRAGTDKGHIVECPLASPMIDLTTIGAGGGSIARYSPG
jgi:hypothetical protein